MPIQTNAVGAEAIDHTVALCIREFIALNLLYSPDGFHFADDTPFLKEGIIDSLGVMELVGFVQQKFGFLVDQGEILPENFGSVALLASFVRRKRSGSAADD